MGNFNQEFIYFKIWDGVKDEKYYYHWGFTEKSNFLGGGGVMKNQYIGGHCLKRGRVLGQFADLGGWLTVKEGS